ncbi:MAG: hypothetical protein M5U28_29395 [Sandaracinaceae bacterium]|nr:hypothetical protein [Sandaracinaceae bacterium]
MCAYVSAISGRCTRRRRSDSIIKRFLKSGCTAARSAIAAMSFFFSSSANCGFSNVRRSSSLALHVTARSARSLPIRSTALCSCASS